MFSTDKKRVRKESAKIHPITELEYPENSIEYFIKGPVYINNNIDKLHTYC